MDAFRDGAGAANSGKYAYQASRAAQGLSTTTRATAAMDLVLGTNAATSGQELAGLGNAAKGANGLARFTPVAKAVNFATKAAPVLARGTGYLGLALGGAEAANGIRKVAQGKTEEGRDNIISGSMTALASGAVMVAAGAGATGVGAPVAAVALGVAAGATAIKYGWEYREEVANFAKGAGKAVGRGFDRLQGLFAS